MEDKKTKDILDESKRVIENFEKTMDDSKTELQDVSCEQVKDAVEKINPDENSMESRG